MNIEPATLRLCRENFLTLEEYVFLYSLLAQQREIWNVDLGFASMSKLERLNFIETLPEDSLQHRLTDYGLRWISSTIPETVIAKGNSNIEGFEKFWKLFPASDKHGNYPETRKIRANKPQTFQMWNKILAEGSDEEQIMLALKREVEDRKNTSSLKGGNGLKYMKGPVKWLETRAFLDYLDQDSSEITNIYGTGFE